LRCQFTLQNADRKAAVGGVKWLYVTGLLRTAWRAARYIIDRGDAQIR